MLYVCECVSVRADESTRHGTAERVRARGLNNFHVRFVERNETYIIHHIQMHSCVYAAIVYHARNRRTAIAL